MTRLTFTPGNHVAVFYRRGGRTAAIDAQEHPEAQPDPGQDPLPIEDPPA